ncbi:MAG: glycyl radical-activating protein [Smithella sp. SDB]|nr:MAG: glycyl radical-activating protein [Smithella sp. SDB]
MEKRIQNIEVRKTDGPLVLEIRGNSLDDGPGIRSVVFMKGCPLSCVWCHNPESKKPSPELLFDASICLSCGTCAQVCESDALRMKKKKLIFDRSKCTLCFACIDLCPSGALERAGKSMTVDDVIDSVMKDKPFYDTSGGGVTLSGGEPLMFMDFASEILASLKKKGIHNIVETCGIFKMERFMELVLPYVDMIYYDIKIMDASLSERYTGIKSDLILANFRTLQEISLKKHPGFLLPRTPLIPGMTDTDENLSAIAEFLSSLGIKKAALLEYNPLWYAKLNKLGKEVQEAGKSREWMDKKHVAHCKEIFIAAGISV